MTSILFFLFSPLVHYCSVCSLCHFPPTAVVDLGRGRRRVVGCQVCCFLPYVFSSYFFFPPCPHSAFSVDHAAELRLGMIWYPVTRNTRNSAGAVFCGLCAGCGWLWDVVHTKDVVLDVRWHKKKGRHKKKDGI